MGSSLQENCAFCKLVVAKEMISSKMIFHYFNNGCVIFFFCKIIPWWFQMVFNDHYWKKSEIKKHFLVYPLFITFYWKPPQGSYHSKTPQLIDILSQPTQRTLDTWNGIFWNIYQNFKPMEIAIKPYNIVCSSLKVMHFCQIIRAWLNIGARYTHLKF